MAARAENIGSDEIEAAGLAGLFADGNGGFGNVFKQTQLKIEILFFAGCPNHLPAVTLVREVLQEMNLTYAPIEVTISDPAKAAPLRFLGSPTVQINGLDIEPSARDSDQFGFVCRTYSSQGRRSGLPTKELVRNAIDEAVAGMLTSE